MRHAMRDMSQGRGASVLVDAGTALPGGADFGRSAVVPRWWTGRDGAVFVGLGTPLWVRGFREPQAELDAAESMAAPATTGRS